MLQQSLFVKEYRGWNVQVSQIPESSEGKFGCSLDLIALNEPVEENSKTRRVI